jgi:hypothetical protein
VESSKGRLYPGRSATKKIFDQQSDATDDNLKLDTTLHTVYVEEEGCCRSGEKDSS